MKVLMMFYDRSILKNYVAALGIAPDIIKFFYDPSVFKYRDIYSTYDALKKYIPHLKYEVGAIDEHDYTNVIEAVETYINETSEDELYIDLTGGSELSVVAAYEAARGKDCGIYFTDISKNQMVNLRTRFVQYQSHPFEIEDTVAAFGGKLMGYTDDRFLEDCRPELLEMATYILKHLKQWLSTCQYFQKYNGPLRQSGRLNFKGPFEIDKKNRKVPDMDVIYQFSKHRMITDLWENSKSVSFQYKNQLMMDYMSSYGVWLELYTYFHLKEVKEIHDLHTSVKVDWNAHDQVEIVGNEIDVTAMYGCRPVIISCKQSTTAVTANALNELYVVSRRIGGKYAIPIMITCSNMKGQHLGMYLKAKEMGIGLLDITDVLSNRFGEKLKNSIVK